MLNSFRRSVTSVSQHDVPRLHRKTPPCFPAADIGQQKKVTLQILQVNGVVNPPVRSRATLLRDRCGIYRPHAPTSLPTSSPSQYGLTRCGEVPPRRKSHAPASRPQNHGPFVPILRARKNTALPSHPVPQLPSQLGS